MDHDHKEEPFSNALIRKVLLEVGKHCELGSPTLINRDVIKGTKFTRFFVKVYSPTESLANLPERVFTLDGSRTLKVGNFKDLCKRAQTVINKNDIEQQLR